MLEIRELNLEVDGRPVLKNLNLTIEEGESHVLLGPNGSGKTSLLLGILGFPKYQVTGGSIIFKGKDIIGLSTADRVKLGMGIAFQHPPVIRGIRLGEMVNLCRGDKSQQISKQTRILAKKLHFSDEFLERDVNAGFSGGEIKRSEIMQLMAQNPDFVMLDEPDSGVDIENMELIGNMIGELLHRKIQPSKRTASGLIITHLATITDYIEVDWAHVMLDGVIACSGSPDRIISEVMKGGYEKCVRECQMTMDRK
ncbi:MAG: putative branched-chain amino acid transport ATP-binding protein LivG [ANME-2 cluster archaeon HR1]|jgi:Fe-S cluster assembly ATP-binding protein|nr:MAG: putative branched-chain amino acid transport ATP-binding protein LivG [ANME-2 cluster archaeon HR1]